MEGACIQANVINIKERVTLAQGTHFSHTLWELLGAWAWVRLMCQLVIVAPNQLPQRTHSSTDHNLLLTNILRRRRPKRARLIAHPPPHPRSHKSSTYYVRSALPLRVFGLDRECIFSKRMYHTITVTIHILKGLVTLLDHPRGLEVAPPIHNPVTPTHWVLRRPRQPPVTNRRMRRVQIG